MPDDIRKCFSKRTVLVTGDTGFKGSWLSIWLNALGANVVGFSLPPKTPQDNWVVCGLDKIIDHVDGDIRDYARLRKVILEHSPSFIFHLAAQALVLDSYKDPLGTIETNVLGTANVLDAIRNTSCVRAAVMIASDKCYENREMMYGYRETDALGGKDPYSASKGASEIVASSYIRSFFTARGTPSIATARAGNVIGGGDWADNRIVPDCIRALRKGRKITIRNPDAVRPWQHVLEPLHGYLTLGARLLREGKPYQGAWNFGPAGTNSVRVRTLVEAVLKEWGAGSYDVAPSSDGKESHLLSLDITKAAHQLGWSPVLDLETTVHFTVEEYRCCGKGAISCHDQRVAQITRYCNLRSSGLANGNVTGGGKR